MELARIRAQEILDADPDLGEEGNRGLRDFLQSQRGKTAWSKIS